MCFVILQTVKAGEELFWNETQHSKSSVRECKSFSNHPCHVLTVDFLNSSNGSNGSHEDNGENRL